MGFAHIPFREIALKFIAAIEHPFKVLASAYIPFAHIAIKLTGDRLRSTNRSIAERVRHVLYFAHIPFTEVGIEHYGVFKHLTHIHQIPELPLTQVRIEGLAPEKHSRSILNILNIPTAQVGIKLATTSEHACSIRCIAQFPVLEVALELTPLKHRGKEYPVAYIPIRRRTCHEFLILDIVEHGGEIGTIDRIPLRKIGTRARTSEHATNILYIGDVPFAQILFHRLSRKEHFTHVFYIVYRPFIQTVTIEAGTVPKHASHGGNLADVPLSEIAIELLTAHKHV